MIRTTWIGFFFTCFISSGIAQVVMSGGFARDSIEIGQEIEFVLSLRVDTEVSIKTISGSFIDSIYSNFQSLNSSAQDSEGTPEPVLADVQIMDLGNWQISTDDGMFDQNELSWDEERIGGQKILENRFSLRIWDPGLVYTLMPTVHYEIDDNQEVHVMREIAQIYVSPPNEFSNIAEDSIRMSPIKSILTEDANLSDYLGFLLAASVVLLGILGFLVVRRWRKRAASDPIVEPEVIIPAHRKALDALFELRESKLWQKGEIKSYQSQLTHIIREYLEDRYNIPALEVTTHQILSDMKSVGLISKDIDSLKKVLQVADLVKFAKAIPALEVHEEFMDEAISFVQRTEEILESDSEITEDDKVPEQDI